MMEVLMDGRMDEWMDGWMDGWMEVKEGMMEGSKEGKKEGRKEGRTEGRKEGPKKRYPQGQRVRIVKADVKRYNPTLNCPGCEAIVDKRKAENHSEECRARFVRLFQETEAGRRRLEDADERRVNRIEAEGKEKGEGGGPKTGGERYKKTRQNRNTDK